MPLQLLYAHRKCFAITMTNFFKFSGTTAVVLGNAQGSNLSIFFKAQSTHTKTAPPMLMQASLLDNSQIVLSTWLLTPFFTIN